MRSTNLEERIFVWGVFPLEARVQPDTHLQAGWLSLRCCFYLRKLIQCIVIQLILLVRSRYKP
jgi:hypothetical protein